MPVKMVRVLSHIWGQAVSASEGDIPDDELAELDPAAYDRLLARKAHKQAEAEQGEFEIRKLKVDAEERKRDEAAARLEAMEVRALHWDQSMTDYGGQQISQAEAQKARQYIVDHQDDVVAWGLTNGQFVTEAEGHRFVDREARLHELNAADRAGTLSNGDRAERATLEQQQQPYSAVQAHFEQVMQQKKVSLEAAPSQEVAISPSAGANDGNPFRSRVPDIKGSFAAQADPSEALPKPFSPEVAMPAQVAAKSLAATGLS